MSFDDFAYHELKDIAETMELYDYVETLLALYERNEKLAEEYPDFIQIMYDCGFTRIKIPGLLSTVGRVMTIPLGAQAMKIDLDKVKQAFEDKGYEVID